MEGLIAFVVSNPSSVLVVVSVGLACLFAHLLFQSFKSQVKDAKEAANLFSGKMDSIKTSLENKLQDTNRKLNSHSDDMGKATKAINGDMLAMKEKVFELKQDLIGEIEKVKSTATETRQSLELATTTSKLALDNLNEKLGRVILIEKSLHTNSAQIEKLQTGVGENKSALAQQHTWFASVAKALSENKKRLETLERERKKDTKNGI